MIKEWKPYRDRECCVVATTYNIWEAVVSSDSWLYGPRFTFAPWDCQIFDDRPLLERLKLLHSLLRSQTASKLPTAVHQDQGALHDVVQLAVIGYLCLVCHQPHIGYAACERETKKKFRRLNFHPLPQKAKKAKIFPRRKYPAVQYIILHTHDSKQQAIVVLDRCMMSSAHDLWCVVPFYASSHAVCSKI